MGCCDHAIGKPNTGTGAIWPKDEEQYIRYSNNSIEVIDGAQSLASLDVCKLRHPYEQFVRTSIKLPPNTFNATLNYTSLLGPYITYLAIVATYEVPIRQIAAVAHNNYAPPNADPAEVYLEYFFVPQPEVVRYFTNIMILTGSENRPLPEVRVNNSNHKISVRLDIIAATTATDPSEGSSAVGEVKITDIFWTDILSDETSGDFIIYKDGISIAYIDRAQIAGIEVNGKIISIDDKAIGQIDMGFVDDWNAHQANSILTWAMDNLQRRIKKGTQADLESPVITYKDDFTTDIKIENDSQWVITKEDLLDSWVESVIDNRDGEIILDNTNIEIIDLSTGNEVNAITRVGKYDITIRVKDIAQNETVDNFVISVSDTKSARQVVKSWVTTYVKELTEQESIYLQDYPNDIINKQDLIDLVIEEIYDEQDGTVGKNVNNVDVEIVENNIVYEVIDHQGTYYTQYTVKDSDKNTSNLLWENKSTILTDSNDVEVNFLILEIQDNDPPKVVWREPEPYEIDLYEFNVNGIISKSQLYKYLVIDVVDD
ncbi:MAG: hypothetical protein ACC656_06555, partial [Candidatus Heimdallarchaeota archaeon]